ncbi:MAG: hypothetical protein ABI083_11990 [Lapillicoccus sp.]
MTDSVSLCVLLQDSASKDLANVEKNPCKAGSDVGRVKTALGAVSGTSSGTNGSYVVTTLVLAGIRDDGLATGVAVLYAVTSPPSSAVQKEIAAIWASVIASQNTA